MLKEYHTKQGVLFLSEEDSEDYFKGLVEIVEELVLKNYNITININKILKEFDRKFVKQGIPIGIAKYESKDGLDITASKIKDFIVASIQHK